MFQKALSFGSVLFLTAAVVLATPSLGQAQRGGHGGGHGGGFHGSGFHGGARFGGFHHVYPFAHHGYRYYAPYYDPYSYPYYSGSYGSYPDSYSSGSYYPDYGSYGDVTPSDAYSYQSFYSPASASAQPDNRADITAEVAADARIWFDGKATKSTGPVHQFHSPALTPGARYRYEVRANWKENGHEVTQTQRVPVAAGDTVKVHFPQQPTSQSSPAKAQH
jgi:uncharacterized protein (TIGR03000 family)